MTPTSPQGPSGLVTACLRSHVHVYIYRHGLVTKNINLSRAYINTHVRQMFWPRSESLLAAVDTFFADICTTLSCVFVELLNSGQHPVQPVISLKT